MTDGLVLAPGFALPLDAATETFGILAKKGAGKSNAAVVMAEEMHKAGIPWVAVDPKGDWWGIRSSGDGTGPGLPIVVFGGRHGDVPLEPTAGPMLADLVLAERLTCVLDVSEFSKQDTRRFLLAFAERLYRQADADPLHLFLEEAHEYLPQRVMGEDANLVGAWQRIVKQGRFKGLGCTLVSQRSAAVNKDVLTQVDTLIVLRTTSPQDRKAVKDWVDVHADAAAMLDTLPSLESGEAWVWSPEFLGVLERIRFRRRATFDSGATPKVGQARRPPATLADVDLAAIKERMADTIEKAKATDPKELTKRIAALERQLRERQPEAPAAEPVVEYVEVPYVPAEVVALVEEMRERGLAVADSAARCLVAANDMKAPARPAPRPPVARTPRPEPAPRVARERAESPGTFTRKAERVILAVLQQHPDGLDREELGFRSGYAHGGGAFGNALGVLRNLGYVEQSDRPGDLIRSTALGHRTDPGEDPPSHVLDIWRARTTRKAEREMLDRIIATHPEVWDRSELAADAGYEPTGGAVGNAIGKLRSLGLVERSSLALTSAFAEAIRPER